MRLQVLSIFPELFEPFKRLGLVSRALSEGQLELETIQLRDFAINTHGQIDDTPYGGGSGMVLRTEPAVAAIEAAKANDPKAKVVLLTPRGKTFNQKMAHELIADADARQGGYILLCCRYEGVDERVIEGWVDQEISIGDFILMGGEVAAMSVIEAMARLLPGVLGNPESIAEESFESGLLEYPHYTKPNEFRGKIVPPVLMSGNHQEIAKWRKQRAVRETKARRPDLLHEVTAPSCELDAALIHYPVLNKEGNIITSSVTNLDMHDIARSLTTYGLNKYYIVHPTKAMRRLCEKICEHWDTGYGARYNPNRREALAAVSLVPDFDDVLLDIETRTGRLPKLIVTSAKPGPKMIGFKEMQAVLSDATEPHLILFGTGWGLAPEIMERADYQLEPISGPTEYNHLSVRAAAAIVFDRLLGC